MSVDQLCLTLCDHMDYSPPASFTHGIFQARILEWVSISISSRVSSQPRDWTQVSSGSCVGKQILYHWATWKVHCEFTLQKFWPQYGETYVEGSRLHQCLMICKTLKQCKNSPIKLGLKKKLGHNWMTEYYATAKKNELARCILAGKDLQTQCPVKCTL